MQKRIAKFEKVSYDQFKKDWLDTFKNKYIEDLSKHELDSIIHAVYDSIKLPKRSTSMSAGYDFYCPSSVNIDIGKSAKIPTGIKCEMQEGWVLQIFPRSSYGFKYGVKLANTVGIIDGDYYNNIDNEGHIFVKLVNDSTMAKPITINVGEAFCQGIFTPFGLTIDDDVNEIRTGGIGSTDKK